VGFILCEGRLFRYRPDRGFVHPKKLRKRKLAVFKLQSKTPSQKEPKHKSSKKKQKSETDAK
jgi:hypothetical protein